MICNIVYRNPKHCKHNYILYCAVDKIYIGSDDIVHQYQVICTLKFNLDSCVAL